MMTRRICNNGVVGIGRAEIFYETNKRLSLRHCKPDGNEDFWYDLGGRELIDIILSCIYFAPIWSWRDDAYVPIDTILDRSVYTIDREDRLFFEMARKTVLMQERRKGVKDEETNKLEDIFEKAQNIEMTEAHSEAQRRSIVYGNVLVGNEYVTPELVNEIAEERRSDG